MNKTQIQEKVVSVATKVCDDLKVAADVKKALTTALENAFAPRGGRVDIESVVRRDNSGKIVELKCAVSGKWLPATKEFFYEDLKGGDTFGGLRRLSRQAEGIRKKFLNAQAKERDAINTQIIAGKLSVEAAKVKLDELSKKNPDYSGVSKTPAPVAAKPTKA